MVDEYLNQIKTKADADKFVNLLRNKDFINAVNNLPDLEKVFKCRDIKKVARMVGEVKLWNEVEKREIKDGNSRKLESYTYYFEENDTTYDTGNWIISEYGVIKKINDLELYAAYQTIIVTKRLINIEDDTEMFELTFDDNGEWKKKNIPRTMLSSGSNVSKLVNYGICIAPSNANNFCNYINDFYNLNSVIIPTVKSISRLGWIDNRFKSFLPYVKGNIICDVEGEYKKIMENFTSRGSYDVWKNNFLNARENHNVRLYTDASFASPLLKIIGINGFIVHLYGDRGKGKTISLMLAMSVWGNPEMGYLTNGIDNTLFGLEKRAEFLQNLPFSGDEMQNIDKKQFNNDTLIYMISNGSGKGRGTKDGQLDRQSSWNLVMLTTGEIPITSDSSRSGCKVRCIEIQNSHEMYQDIDLMQFANIIKNNYGFAGEEYIKYLIELGKDEIRKRFEETKEELLKESQVKLDSKQLNAVSALKLADELVRERLFSEEKKLGNSEFLGLVKDEDEINIAIRAKESVISEIIRERYYFDDEKDSEEVKAEKRLRRNKTNGKINFEKQEVYINLNCLKEYLEKFGFNFNMVKEKWAEDGIIEVYSSKQKYYTRYGEYGTVVKFKKLYDSDLENIEPLSEPPF